MSPQPALFATRKTSEKHHAIDEQIIAAGIPDPELEWQFHPVRKWRLDRAWPLHKIALEIEGGGFGRYIVITSGFERKGGNSIPIKPGTSIRVGGRHNSGDGMESDIEKYNAAAILGWMVIRATTRQIRDGVAITDLLDAFKARGVEIRKTVTQ